MTEDHPASDSSSENLRKERAFEELSDEIRRVEDGQLIQIRLDIPAAVTTAIGVLPRVLALRAQIIEHLPTFDPSTVDKLESYAMALFEAHADYVSSIRPPEVLAELVAEATQQRDLLYAEVQVLILRGLIDPHEIREVRTGTGHKALTVDLQVLANTLQRKWEVLQDKTSIQRTEVFQAEQLVRRLIRAMGEREQQPAVAEDAVANRSKSFTLFIKTYEEIRAAVLYLRRKEGDGDKLTPSLYAGRGARRKVDESPPATPGNGGNPSQPAPVVPPAAGAPGTSPTPAPGAVTSPTSAALPAPAPTLRNGLIGVPDGEPFLPTG